MDQVRTLPKIMIVDDAPTNLDVLIEALRGDYAVTAATGGEEALEAVDRDPPDLILLDILMPGLDGYEVCRRLKDDPKTADIPVIFVTVMDETEDETAGFQAGAVDYITKPIRPPVVRARVRTHLALLQANRQLVRQNRQLREYARLRDEVERMTRHDLKSPLSAVLSVPDMLMEELDLSSDQRELLLLLQESGHRMLQIINSSLDLYKMETGRYRPTPGPVDIIALVVQIRAETRELLHAKNLRLRFLRSGRPVRDKDLIWASGEEMLLYTMLANLLKNAAEASPPGECITVSLEEEGDKALIRIHNQGSVPEKIRSCFFDKFVTAGKSRGTGLGTYTARLIARTMSGDIRMSTSPEEGTLLEVEMPLSPKPGEPKTRYSFPAREQIPVQDEGGCRAPSGPDLAALFGTGRAPGRGHNIDPELRILVVDDYPSIRRITGNALQRMGFTRIVEAENGQAALALILEQDFGLIISDMTMPLMGGLELLKAVRGRPDLGPIPFILLTGNPNPDIMRAAARAGASAFILKPFSPDAFKDKIEKILAPA